MLKIPKTQVRRFSRIAAIPFVGLGRPVPLGRVYESANAIFTEKITRRARVTADNFFLFLVIFLISLKQSQPHPE